MAIGRANNLAVGAGIPTPYSVKIFIQKASRNAKALAISSKIMTSYTLPILITEANSSAKVIQSLIENKS